MPTSARPAASPYRDADHLRSLLEQVYGEEDDSPEAGLLTRSGLAVAFVYSRPELTVLVDGRQREVQVSFGAAAAQVSSAPLIFSMDGPTAHAFWLGELNVVTAMTLGRIRLQGSPLSALKIAPMMPRLQNLYRRVWAQQALERSGPTTEGGA